MTNDELGDAISKAIHDNPPTVRIGVKTNFYNYDAAAKAVMTVVFNALMEPDGRMIKAASKSMSPAFRPTEEYIPSAKKHAHRFKEMVKASPLSPREYE